MGRRIGFVLSNISQGSSRAMWRMAAESAVGEHSEDALFIFPGGRLGYSQDEEALRNGIYDLVGPQSLDGAIIWATSMMGAGNPEICLSFVKRVASSIPADIFRFRDIALTRSPLKPTCLPSSNIAKTFWKRLPASKTPS